MATESTGTPATRPADSPASSPHPPSTETTHPDPLDGPPEPTDALAPSVPLVAPSDYRFRNVVSSSKTFNYYLPHPSTPLPQWLLDRFTWYIHYPVLADLEQTLSNPLAPVYFERLKELHQRTFPSTDTSPLTPIGDFSHLGAGPLTPYAQGFVCAEHSTRSVVVAFAGIKLPRQYLQTLHTAPVHITWPAPSGCGFRAHGGFLRLYTAVQERLRDVLGQALARYPDYSLVFSGYSQGAALATLAILDIAFSGLRGYTEDGRDKHGAGVMVAQENMTLSPPSPPPPPPPLLDGRDVTFYAYSSPRVLSADGAAWLTKQFMLRENWQLYRLTREQDMVPLLPPAMLGYRHIGTCLYGVVGDEIPRQVKVVENDVQREGNIFGNEAAVVRWRRMLAGVVRSGKYHTEY